MWRCQVSGALNTPKATATRAGTGERCQIVLPDQAGWWCVVDVETIGPCPRPGIVTDIFGFEDLLHGRHDLVDGVPGCVRRIGIAPGLDRLDFRQLLRQRLFRRKNVVDFLISFPCNAGQPAPQIVDGVSGGIEGALLYFVLLCLSDLGFRSPKVPANQVFGRSTLIPQQKIMLADQIPCELLLLHGPSGPVLRGGT
ncbi:hypothetical protein TMFG_02138 [Mycobacterium tuberculosis SUMu006]|nr:hypothetical protein TMFG_02138 [Mycobacterium tuberculosis SUMu006]